MPTATTLPLLLLIAVLWRITRGQVLPIVMVASIFGAGSALNLGGLGVLPWMFTLVVCMLAKLMLKGSSPLRMEPGSNRIALRLLLCFVSWALLSAICFPWIFEGVYVDHGPNSGPLTWHASNLAQSVYLIAVCSVYLLTIGNSKEERQETVRWYIRACVIVSCFAFYQLAGAAFHIPYPSAILDTSPSYTIFPAYKISGVWRLDATFCEASEMAGFLLPGLALMGWDLIVQPARLRNVAAFIMTLGALLFSMSSTGYVGLITLLFIGVTLFALRVLRQQRISPVFAIALIVGVGTISTSAIVSKDSVAFATKVINSTILDKGKTESYRERTATHDSALRTFADTAGMGAGWGSVRSSGLGFVLLGTVGLPGLLLFLGFFATSFRPLFYARPPSAKSDRLAPTLLAASIVLIAMFLAGSEPVNPVFWMLLGVAAAERPLTPARALITHGGTNHLSGHTEPESQFVPNVI